MDISAVYSAGRLLIGVKGELDQHRARQIKAQAEEQMDVFLPKECALDLSGLRFMDSSGIAVILALRKRMEELGGSLILVNIPQQPMRVLEAAGIERLVPIGVRIGEEAAQ